MEKKPSIHQLYHKFLDHSINEEEYHELLHHFGADLRSEELREMILSALKDQGEEEIMALYRSQIMQTVKNVKTKLLSGHHRTPMKRRIIWKPFFPYAAAMLILMAGIFSYRFFAVPVSKSIAGLNVGPGSNKAVLKLQNGEEIILSGQQEGIVTHAGQIDYADGTLIKAGAGVQMISISTPLSGQYQVQLPDGTKAWLNASSSIHYPTHFTDNERKITVTGEVYLEVAKDVMKKFIVVVKHQKIEVLGTHFNINAYEDDGRLYTTLAEGSLQVTGVLKGNKVMLHPGEQAILTQGEQLAVKRIDVNEVISWKDGFYLIKNQPLSVFSKQLERWYNVEIDMGDKGDLRLSAMIPRDVPLFEVLQAIELKTGIQFTMEERRIMVK